LRDGVRIDVEYDISNMRIFSGFSGDSSGASQSESDAQSENSEMYVFCLKMRLLMICAGDAAGFSSFERVLTFVRVYHVDQVSLHPGS